MAYFPAAAPTRGRLGRRQHGDVGGPPGIGLEDLARIRGGGRGWRAMAGGWSSDRADRPTRRRPGARVETGATEPAYWSTRFDSASRVILVDDDALQPREGALCVVNGRPAAPRLSGVVRRICGGSPRCSACVAGGVAGAVLHAWAGPSLRSGTGEVALDVGAESALSGPRRRESAGPCLEAVRQVSATVGRKARPWSLPPRSPRSATGRARLAIQHGVLDAGGWNPASAAVNQPVDLGRKRFASCAPR